MTTTIVVRAATVEDVPRVAELMREYMHELFGSAWHGSAEALARDGFGAAFDLMVAARPDGELVAFAGWPAGSGLELRAVK